MVSIRKIDDWVRRKSLTKSLRGVEES